MKIVEKKLKGVFEIILEPHIDDRGFFMRTFDRNLFEKAGIHSDWMQENHARSEKKNVIRGLHFQFPPYSETKLVRSVSGMVLDVFVDLRKNSDTFGQWDSVLISDEKKNMVLIPRGFAHGYRTITEVSEILYKVDNFYRPEYEGGIMWSDEELNIDWQINEEIDPVLSNKDKRNMSFQDFVNKYGSLEQNK